MQRHSAPFKLAFSNIPIINLRLEYSRYLDYFESGRFMSDLSKEPGTLHTPYMTWHAFPEPFLTTVLMRCLSGLECYHVIAVHAELHVRDRATKDALAELEEPGGRGGAAEHLFNRLPSLVDRELEMRRSASKLWGRTKLFYEQVRNPVFHGFEIVAKSIRAFPEAFRHIGDIYDWIDSWHNADLGATGIHDMIRVPPRRGGGV